MLKLALVAVAILLAPSASAQTLMITRSCAGGSCVTTIGPAGRGLGAVKSVPQPSDADVRELIEAREAKWVEFCKPEMWQDPSSGYIWRYRYAHPGCENGRIE
jgi:hypothetical protein